MSPSSLEVLLPLGVLTGSRAFDCATELSDWDIVLIESNLPSDLLDRDIISDTNFSAEWENYYDPAERKPGYAIDEEVLPELGDDFIEYDQITIWGPIARNLKYIDEHNRTINLFVYQDKYASILNKFKELNSLIVFLHGTKLMDKQYRIQAFIELTDKLGITNHN